MGRNALDRAGAIQPRVLSKGPGVVFAEVALCWLSQLDWVGGNDWPARDESSIRPIGDSRGFFIEE